MNYEQAIAFLQSFPDSERGSLDSKAERHLKMPLSAMKSFLQTLGNPQNSAKTIHITGSKGKGSTATFITAILNKAGYKTALFTSPHLHSYTERIAFDLTPISQSLFAAGIEQLKPYINDFEKEDHVFSTFGILTALFFHLVKESQPPIDWQIVEVGLGGKDDLTNVFDRKEAAVITAISLEHTAILGNTISLIAENKAGIITPNCLTILASQTDPLVEEVIKSICEQKHSQLILPNQVLSTQENLLHENPFQESFPFTIKMPGVHQVDNAKTAYALAQALKQKGYNINNESIISGLNSAFLPGRFEIIKTNFLNQNGSKAPASVVLDGAHNGDSALALAKTLEEYFPGQPIVFIIGVNQDKNLEDIFFALKNTAKKFIATRSDNYRALSPKNIRDRILACDPNMEVVCKENIAESILEAKREIFSGAVPSDIVVCVCGSFYLVAEAREIFTIGSWQDFFKLIESLNIPADFMTDRECKPPEKRELF